jgi:hypothetical protein
MSGETNSVQSECSRAASPREAAIEKLLLSCPTAGDGVNPWLFTAALKLHEYEIEPVEIEELLENATVDCGRDLKSDEIARAVRNSAPGALQNRPWRRRWPERNYEQIEAIGLNGIRVAELVRRSPVKFDPAKTCSEVVINSLFPGNPLLCAGPSLTNNRTRSREEWRGFLDRQQFIVPSPMSKTKGLNQEGKLSFRSLDNTGERAFQVVEFDFVETDGNDRDTAAAPMLRRLAAEGVTIADLCAALHGELAKSRPMALVVHSAGKSLHGWYPCEGDEEAVIHRFMRFAVSIGADRATWTRSQLVRMPDGIRNNGKRQRVLYFNPIVIGGAK